MWAVISDKKDMFCILYGLIWIWIFLFLLQNIENKTSSVYKREIKETDDKKGSVCHNRNTTLPSPPFLVINNHLVGKSKLV